jgi:hypothetical protein
MEKNRKNIEILRHKISHITTKPIFYFFDYNADVYFLLSEIDDIFLDEKKLIKLSLINIEVVYCAAAERGDDFYNQKDVEYIEQNLHEINLNLEKILSEIQGR